MLPSSTAIATSFSWLLFKQQIAPMGSNVYTMLTILWKFSYHSPKGCENLNEVQKVLDLPELKITKPSDTRWLAHERSISAVKRCYGAIVTTLKQIYEGSHEPETLSWNRILRRSFAIYLLDFLLP